MNGKYEQINDDENQIARFKVQLPLKLDRIRERLARHLTFDKPRTKK